jgi:hypothetical protein
MYLKELYALMRGDVSDLEKQTTYVLQRYIEGKLELPPKKTPLDQQLLTAFVSLYGVFN